MLNFVKLRKTASSWEFDSEEALEDFVWANLPALFGLRPLKRQHIVKGQFCDILALGENNELVVLELKNAEDRYVVQQLTRYYDALREEKPFSEQIDYDRPIRLVAVAPSFHRDNFTDRKYSHLSVEFLHFEILTAQGRFYLKLKDVDTGKASQLEVPYQEREDKDNIPTVSRTLHTLLAKCTTNDQEGILKIRRQILNFDARMQEVILNRNIKYGKGKKICAELRFDGELNRPVMFLWLPLIVRRAAFGRMRVWTDWVSVSNIAYVPKGIGKLRTVLEVKSDPQVQNKKLRYNTCSLKSSYNSLVVVAYEFKQYVEEMKYYGTNESYMKMLNIINAPNSLERLVDLSCDNWRKKI